MKNQKIAILYLDVRLGIKPEIGMVFDGFAGEKYRTENFRLTANGEEYEITATPVEPGRNERKG
jgi:hypothetical protein